jgi:predicted dehydrogenase
MAEKVKIGIVGTGHMGQYHVNVAKQLTMADFIGIYDADSERSKIISEKYGTKAFLTIEEMIQEVDAIVVAAPTFFTP